MYITKGIVLPKWSVRPTGRGISFAKGQLRVTEALVQIVYFSFSILDVTLSRKYLSITTREHQERWLRGVWPNNVGNLKN